MKFKSKYFNLQAILDDTEKAKVKNEKKKEREVRNELTNIEKVYEATLERLKKEIGKCVSKGESFCKFYIKDGEKEALEDYLYFCGFGVSFYTDQEKKEYLYIKWERKANEVQKASGRD